MLSIFRLVFRNRAKEDGHRGGWSKGRRLMENETEAASRQLGNRNQAKGGDRAEGKPCVEVRTAVGKTPNFTCSSFAI